MAGGMRVSLIVSESKTRPLRDGRRHRKSIPYQLAVRRSGGTDARAFTTSGLGVPSVVIGVPARYIHTHNAVIHLDDYLATVALVVEVARRLDNTTIAGFTSFLAP